MIADLAVKSGILALLGWLIAGTLRRSSAATRSFVLVLTVTCLAILPIALPHLPKWEAPFMQVQVVPSRSLGNQAAAVGDASNSWPLAIYFAGVSVLGLRLLTGLVRLALKRRSLTPVRDLRLLEIAAECAGRRSRIRLFLGSAGDPPMTWGVWRPVLLLPLEAVEWDGDRLRSVILHELAHIERGDWAANFLAECVCAIYWPNPIVWMIARAMANESERAADDRVLDRGLRASQYAGHLLEIVKESRSPTALAGIAMAKPAGLEGRVRAILSDAACRRPLRGSAALALVLLCALVSLAVGGAAPKVVGANEPDRGGTSLQAPSLSVTTERVARSDDDVFGANFLRDSSSDRFEGSASVHPQMRVHPTSHASPQVARPLSATVDFVDENEIRKTVQDSLESAQVELRVQQAMKESSIEVQKALSEADRNIAEAMRTTAESLRNSGFGKVTFSRAPSGPKITIESGTSADTVSEMDGKDRGRHGAQATEQAADPDESPPKEAEN